MNLTFTSKALDKVCERYPNSEYIFPNVCYENQLAVWTKKEQTGTLKAYSKMPTPFLSIATLSENIRRYRDRSNMESFTPRDFCRTFKA